MTKEWNNKVVDNFVILNKVLGSGVFGTVY